MSGCVGEVCWGRDDARGLELAPLYYPDTLVNQDTCLGVNGSLFRQNLDFCHGVRHNQIWENIFRLFVGRNLLSYSNTYFPYLITF